jgi:hypothetical protein
LIEEMKAFSIGLLHFISGGIKSPIYFINIKSINMKNKGLWIIIACLWVFQSAPAQTYVAQVKPVGSKYWGYINLNGEMVIEAKYSKNFPFSADGFAPVLDARTKEYYFIDLNDQKLNTEIKGFKLSILGFGVKGFDDGLVPVKYNKKWGYLDIQGRVKIPCKYDRATEFNGGYAAFLCWIRRGQNTR